jgi:hypothetical protein
MSLSRVETAIHGYISSGSDYVRSTGRYISSISLLGVLQVLLILCEIIGFQWNTLKMTHGTSQSGATSVYSRSYEYTHYSETLSTDKKWAAAILWLLVSFLLPLALSSRCSDATEPTIGQEHEYRLYPKHLSTFNLAKAILISFVYYLPVLNTGIRDEAVIKQIIATTFGNVPGGYTGLLLTTSLVILISFCVYIDKSKNLLEDVDFKRRKVQGGGCNLCLSKLPDCNTIS